MNLMKKNILVLVFVACFLVLHAHAQNGQLNEQEITYFQVDNSGLSPCGLYIENSQSTSNSMVPLKQITYNLQIVNSLVHITMVQEYFNPSSKFLNVYYSFPINPNTALYRITAQFDDKIVEGVVKEKETAKKEFQQYKKEGKQVLLTLLDQKSKDVVNMKIGNIKPRGRVRVKIAFVQEMTVSLSSFYRVQIPSTISPRYMNTVPQESIFKEFEGITDVIDLYYPVRKTGYIWNFNIDIKTYRRIKFFDSPTHKLDILKSQLDGKHIALTLRSSTPPNADFIFLYTTEKFQEPSYVLGQSANSQDKTTTVMVSFIPKFSSLSPEEAFKNKEEKIQFDLNSVKGEYIFILDRSGSMDDSQRIEKAKLALTIFLKSLPPDSYFNVVSFGSSYQFMFQQSKKYENRYLNQALTEISRMLADFGGTEIYFPLEKVLSSPQIAGYPKFVFMLTDGQVQNTEGVIRMAQAKARSTRINTIGVGNGASLRLLEGCAEAGRGRNVMITDDQDPSNKIINLLSSALTPLITDMTLTYDKNQVKIAIPNPNRVGYIIKDDAVNFYLFYKDGLKQKTKISLKYQDPITKQKFESELQIDPSQKSYPFVEKMAHFRVLRGLENLSHDSKLVSEEIMIYEVDENYKNQAIKYSIKHQILSQYTAFLAVVKEISDYEKSLFKQVGYLSITVPQALTDDQVNAFRSGAAISSNTAILFRSPSLPSSIPSAVINALNSVTTKSGMSSGMGSGMGSGSGSSMSMASSGNSGIAGPNLPSSIPTTTGAAPPPVYDQPMFAKYNPEQDQPLTLQEIMPDMIQTSMPSVPLPSPLPTPSPHQQPKSSKPLQQTLLQFQNTDGSWTDRSLLQELKKSCAKCNDVSSPAIALIQEIQTLGLFDLLITRLAVGYLDWALSKDPNAQAKKGQYMLILRKGIDWVLRQVKKQNIPDLLQKLDQIVKQFY